MNQASTILQHLPDLSLLRLGPDEAAGLWITSLPWPRAARPELTLGMQPTFSQPLGQWPDEPADTPRRMLLIADGGNAAPQQVPLGTGRSLPNPAGPALSAEMELFERSPHTEYVWERHMLRLRHGSRSVGLAMGLRTGDEIHWWEACGLVVQQSTEQCLVVEMGGAIPRSQMSFEEFKKYPGVTNPYLHKHNWLNGHLYARLHANGVCEIYAHHINSKFFDDGVDLQNAVPVIGIYTGADADGIEELCGEWDGSREGFTVGDAQLDLREVARLATPQQPGQVSQHGEFLVLQPYQGMELFGGLCPEQLIDDSFIYRAENKVIPRGMARTLRFSLSLSDRSPRIARYVAPAWWYGVCEELLPVSLLPVSDDYDVFATEASQWVLDLTVQGGFEDGSIPRHTSLTSTRNQIDGSRVRYEPGWEGEIPYAAFLNAWRTGDAEQYQAALRAAYYFTDVCVDHAAKAVRMHGYPPNAFSVPMNRMQASIAAYLETGDGYLRDIAEAVTANSYWTHKNSWPRQAVGRDACFVRSAVLLYRYFATDFFRTVALEGAKTVIQSQRANGSFGDQGGGTGLHQWGGYISKPWMGLLALGGVLDYLELFPEETALLESVRKFADWLMAERFELDGRMVWAYQHDFNGTRRYYHPTGDEYWDLPTPFAWHQESLGRLLCFCALRFDRPEYLDAWMQSRGESWEKTDHGAAAALQFIPWVQAHLWNARLTDETVTDVGHDPIRVSLVPFDLGLPRTALIHGPAGMREVQRKVEQC